MQIKTISEHSSEKYESNESQRTSLSLLKNVYGDAQRYLQIIVNFLSNAIKFTNKDGAIIIRLQIVEY